MRLLRQIILGAVVRVLLAPFLAHPYDVYNWFTAAQSLALGHTSFVDYLAPYTFSYFLFAFPGYAAYLAVTRFVPSFTVPMASLPPALNPGAIWNILVVPGVWFDLFVKLPLIVSDLLVGYMMYLLVLGETGKRRLAEVAAFAWIFNPLVIWVSSGWGMFDTLPILFTVASVYFVVAKKRAVPAGVFLGIAVVLKVYPLLLFLPIALVVYRRSGMRGLIWFTVSGLAALALILAPALSESLVSISKIALNYGYSGPQLPTYFGLTFWNVFSLGFGIDLGVLYVPLVVCSLGFTALAIFRLRTGSDLVEVCAGATLLIVATLLFFPFVGENFPIWFFPFFSILVAVRGMRARPIWVLAVVAVLFSIGNTLLPFFLLPTATWTGTLLVAALALVDPYRIVQQGAFHSGFGLGSDYLMVLGAASWVIFAALWWQLVHLRPPAPDEGGEIPDARVYLARSGVDA